MMISILSTTSLPSPSPTMIASLPFSHTSSMAFPRLTSASPVSGDISAAKWRSISKYENLLPRLPSPNIMQTSSLAFPRLTSANSSPISGDISASQWRPISNSKYDGPNIMSPRGGGIQSRFSRLKCKATNFEKKALKEIFKCVLCKGLHRHSVSNKSFLQHLLQHHKKELEELDLLDMFLQIDIGKNSENNYAAYVRTFRQSIGEDVSDSKYQQIHESAIQYKRRITHEHAVKAIWKEANEAVEAVIEDSLNISKAVIKDRRAALSLIAKKAKKAILCVTREDADNLKSTTVDESGEEMKAITLNTTESLKKIQTESKEAIARIVEKVSEAFTKL